jgi:DNA-binding XRE family transcriptional regulator
MARAALRWARADLAEEAGVAERTVQRFEDDATVAPETSSALAFALEREGVIFIPGGAYKGGVVPPIE